MHILRRVLGVSFIVFAIVVTSSATTVFAYTSSASTLSSRTVVAQVSSLHSPATSAIPKSIRAPLNPSSPPHGCTAANDGEVWIDPDNNERWECFCFDKFRPDGQRVRVCAWALVLPKPNPSTWEDVNSNLLMDVEGVSKNNGARIHQWSYTGGSNQWWKMVHNPNFFRDTVLEAVSSNSGKCLGVSAASKSQGAWIVQWDCVGASNQGWVWAWTGGFDNGWPVWNLVNMNSNMCLGISGGSIYQGAYAVQWGCAGSLDQEWF